MTCPECNSDYVEPLIGKGGSSYLIYECQDCKERFTVERVRPKSEEREEREIKYGTREDI